jgi:hypothetical protein
MLGLMQQHPLLLSSIIAHAARHHGEAEVVSKLPEGALHRTLTPRSSGAPAAWPASCRGSACA